MFNLATFLFDWMEKSGNEERPGNMCERQETCCDQGQEKRGQQWQLGRKEWLLDKLKPTAPAADGCGGTGAGECHRSFQGVQSNADRVMLFGQKQGVLETVEATLGSCLLPQIIGNGRKEFPSLCIGSRCIIK